MISEKAITFLDKGADPSELVPLGKVFFYYNNGTWKFKDDQQQVRSLGENLTLEQVQDLLSSSFQDSTTIDFTYDDVGNFFTASVVQNASQRFVTDAEKAFWNAKEPAISAGTTSQYYRGDKTFQALDKNAVGLSNVDNTSDANKPISTATQLALNAKYDASNPNNYETPAQLNTRDTNNRNRANHTGTQLASTISDLANAVRSVVLTGVSFATDSAILATDSILTAFGKLQAQINSHFGSGGTAHAQATTSVAGFMSALDKTKLDGLTNDVVLKTSTQLNNTSNTVFTTVNEHAINVVAGNTYVFEMLLRFQTAVNTTGIGLSVGGTATGALTANANGITGTGTAGLFSGPLTALNGVVTTSGVAAANTPYLARITGIFTATTSGLIYPQFRSEVNGSQVSVLANSVTTFKEII